MPKYRNTQEYRNKIDQVFKETKDEDFWGLYKEDFINYKTFELRKYYAEYISKNILTIKEKFQKKDPVKRKPRGNNTYFLDHSECKVNESEREEENFVKEIVIKRRKIRKLGIPFYFQLPIKDEQKSDKGKSDYGKIDLLTYTGRGTIYIVEVKYADSEESALRAILEIAAYYHLLGGKEPREEDSGISKILKEANGKRFIYKDSEYTVKNAKKIKMAVLFFEGTKPAEDVKKIKEIKKIAKELDVKIVVADPEELGLTSK
ncbi:MAG: hypothetical protein J6P03_01565 [Opitutales bacterium]|nr:hypothetical protein [Opitutales bacterium]